jgi:hypothetical protein
MQEGLESLRIGMEAVRDDMASKADIERFEKASIELEKSILFIGIHSKDIPIEYRKELATRYFKINGNHITKQYIKGLFDPKCDWRVNENGIGYFECK